MTNGPVCDERLANLSRYDFTNMTRQTPLPGPFDPRDRVVRSACYLQMLTEPRSEREAIADDLAIARNASVPFGAPNYAQGTLYNTECRTAIDLTSRRHFFELTTTPNVIWMDLAKFDLKVGAPVMVLNPDAIDIAGNVSAKFQSAKSAPF
jgi:penicillin V acylase-like amidase (Ntn superfamily)